MSTVEWNDVWIDRERWDGGRGGGEEKGEGRREGGKKGKRGQVGICCTCTHMDAHMHACKHTYPKTCTHINK